MGADNYSCGKCIYHIDYRSGAGTGENGGVGGRSRGDDADNTDYTGRKTECPCHLFSYDLENYGKNGLDCTGMNTDIQTDEAVRASISNADALFITVGSNDLLNTFKSSVREILETETRFRSVDEASEALTQSVAENPMLILKVIEAIQNWDYESFEEQWVQMMETVRSLKKEDTWIVVTNIYNPASNLELPSTMNRVIEEIIRNMNQIMEAHAEEFEYHVADVYHTDVYEHVQEDGIHPDQNGQQIIADRILIHK